MAKLLFYWRHLVTDASIDTFLFVIDYLESGNNSYSGNRLEKNNLRALPFLRHRSAGYQKNSMRRSPVGRSRASAKFSTWCWMRPIRR
jgi:hypothetical protein